MRPQGNATSHCTECLIVCYFLCTSLYLLPCLSNNHLSYMLFKFGLYRTCSNNWPYTIPSQPIPRHFQQSFLLSAPYPPEAAELGGSENRQVNISDAADRIIRPDPVAVRGPASAEPPPSAPCTCNNRSPAVSLAEHAPPITGARVTHTAAP